MEPFERHGDCAGPGRSMAALAGADHDRRTGRFSDTARRPLGALNAIAFSAGRPQSIPRSFLTSSRGLLPGRSHPHGADAVRSRPEADTAAAPASYVRNAAGEWARSAPLARNVHPAAVRAGEGAAGGRIHARRVHLSVAESVKEAAGAKAA